MTAPNLETLFDIEDVFEDTAKYDIAVAITTPTISIFKTYEESDLIVPRVEVNFELGSGLEPIKLSGNGSNEEYMAYEASFTVKVVTDATLEGNETEHKLIRSKLRSLYTRNSDAFPTASLNYYSLKYLKPENTSYDNDDDFYVSELSYSMIIGIKDDSFPV